MSSVLPLLSSVGSMATTDVQCRKLYDCFVPKSFHLLCIFFIAVKEQLASLLFKNAYMILQPALGAGI